MYFQAYLYKPLYLTVSAIGGSGLGESSTVNISTFKLLIKAIFAVNMYLKSSPKIFFLPIFRITAAWPKGIAYSRSRWLGMVGLGLV